MIDTLLQQLEASFDIINIEHGRKGLTNISVERSRAETLLRELRDKHDYAHLSFVTAVDWIEEDELELVYMVHNFKTHHSLSVHVRLPRDNPSMDSIHKLWAQGWTYQRELREMYGIDFPGSPRLHEDFMLEGWDDMPPMLRDFNTEEYSTENFGHREGRQSEDPREYMRNNLYPNRGGDAQ